MEYKNSYIEVQEALEAYMNAWDEEEKALYLQQLLDFLSPLIRKKIKHYYGISYGETFQDLYQDGVVRCIELIMNFDLDRGIRFLGYMQRMLGCFFFDKVRGAAKYQEASLDESYMESEQEAGYGLVEMDSLLTCLGDREQQLIQRHVMRKEKLMMVAEDLGISYAYAKQLKKIALTRLKEHL